MFHCCNMPLGYAWLCLAMLGLAFGPVGSCMTSLIVYHHIHWRAVSEDHASQQSQPLVQPFSTICSKKWRGITPQPVSARSFWMMWCKSFAATPALPPPCCGSAATAAGPIRMMAASSARVWNGWQSTDSCHFLICYIIYFMPMPSYAYVCWII